MREQRPSRTAQAVCVFRAAEQRRAEPIVEDPLAARFLPRALRAAAWTWGTLPPRAVVGLSTYVLARHAFLDRAIQQALSDGAEQVVLLGAGYDSRAWRLAEPLGDRVIWEVDHPATSARKSTLARGLPATTRRVVAVDFERQRLEDRLLEEGFDPKLRTFWVWEGVSMYLTRAAVLDTLATIKRMSGPGSSIGMDLWFYLDDPRMAATWRRMSAGMLHLFGEPITFGVHPEEAAAFFASQGFAIRDLADAAALRQRHVRDGRWVMPECYVVVVEAA
ncbi:MAG: SAM-dependent methyltransferase [Proteobacteria bacterium]|nr:SAM-dependent methyltransferase [Pseudomonadota bacterium]